MAVFAPSPARDELLWLLRQARAPRLRSIRQFAEDEVIIPDGVFEGMRFRCDRQPFSAMWFDLLADRRWNRKFAVGCTQSGKTLQCVIIPCLYHLFEIGEKVGFAVPDMDMAADKWREDLLPVIERTKYRELLPNRGGGSRGGGKFEAIQFLNGATLRFFSGGGSDKSRSGYTTRVIVSTEIDGLDTSGEASREASKFDQIEARTLNFGENKCIYGECTVSIEQGRIWTEYLNGTRTDPHLKCPHCQQYSKLEREHLTGWQHAASEYEAKHEAAWCCPKCAALWTEADRRQANRDALPLHRGQTITPSGEVCGDLPPTQTLSFRWHAVHNFFYDAGYAGQEEWKAARSIDDENDEKKMRQWVFTIPVVPSAVEANPLTITGIVTRLGSVPKGTVPADTDFVTIGVDLGKWKCWYLVLAFRTSGQIHVVDYDHFVPDTGTYGEEVGILQALRHLRTTVFDRGWTQENVGQARVADEIWVDSNNWPEVAHQFCAESGDNVRPIIGCGEGNMRRPYSKPRAKSKTITHIGDDWHFVWDAKYRAHVAEINVDEWKSYLHDRLCQAIGEAGALLVAGNPSQLKELAKHFTSEAKMQEFVPGKGLVTKWNKKHRANHLLDCANYAMVAGNFCGFQLIEPIAKPAPPPEPEPTPLLSPDGRPYLVTER